MQPIHTDRLILREFRESDGPAFARLLADPDVMRFSRNGPYSTEHAMRWFGGILRDYTTYGYGLWAVIARDDTTDTPLGYCGIAHYELDGVREFEVGYRLLPSVWGKGYATEAAHAVADIAFDRIKTDHLIALIDPANTASRRVAEKIGMTPWRDIDWHGIPVTVYRCERANES